MALDIELPLWTIRPNWTEGVLERLSWLTDVIPSSYGTEQRRALRLTPRREFEMEFNPVDNARSYFELFLHRFGSEEFMLPLFHDRGKLTADIAAGTVTIPVDTVNREFVVGGMAVLLGDDPFTYDKLEVTAVAAGSINVNAGGVTRAWPKGASLYPLRRSRIEQESQASALTNRVGQGTLLFQLNQDNLIANEGAWGTLYGGHPVMLDKPNRREVVDLSFLRNSLTLDNDHGLIALGDDAGRAFTTQTHMEMIRGRAEHATFRQFLYRLRGQQGAIWVPSFNQDFVLSQPAGVADAALTIRKIGYGLTGGAISGRRHVLVNDSVMAEITGTGAEPSATEELLTLSGAVGTALLAGTRGSFMDTCRLASDDIEIVHHTDTDGLAECNLSFRSFRDERVPPAITRHPIPAGAILQESCGTSAPEEAGCVTIESGFLARFRFEWNHGANQPRKQAGMNLDEFTFLGSPSDFTMTTSSTNTFFSETEGIYFLSNTGYARESPYLPNNDPWRPVGTYSFVAQIQFPAYTFFDEGVTQPGGYGKAFMALPNGAYIPMTPTTVGTSNGSIHGTDPMAFYIESLWPTYYKFTWNMT